MIPILPASRFASVGMFVGRDGEISGEEALAMLSQARVVSRAKPHYTPGQAGAPFAGPVSVYFFLSTALLLSSELITPISLLISADFSGGRSSSRTTNSRE